MFVDKLRGHGKARLDDEKPAAGNRRQRREDLADSLGEGGTSHDTVRDVRAQTHPVLHELLLRDIQGKKLIHTHKGGRRVGAATGHTRGHRNLLYDAGADAVGDAVLPADDVNSAVDEILFVHRKIRQIRPQGDPAGVVAFQNDPVIQLDRLHDHPHFVVSIFPSSDYVQPEVDLPVGFQIKRLSHRLFLLCILYT